MIDVDAIRDTLPEALQAQLLRPYGERRTWSAQRNDVYFGILDVLADYRAGADVDQLLVGIWQRRGVISTRASVHTVLAKLRRAGKVSGVRGFYWLNPVAAPPPAADTGRRIPAPANRLGSA